MSILIKVVGFSPSLKHLHIMVQQAAEAGCKVPETSLWRKIYAEPSQPLFPRRLPAMLYYILPLPDEYVCQLPKLAECIKYFEDYDDIL